MSPRTSLTTGKVDGIAVQKATTHIILQQTSPREANEDLLLQRVRRNLHLQSGTPGLELLEKKHSKMDLLLKFFCTPIKSQQKQDLESRMKIYGCSKHGTYHICLKPCLFCRSTSSPTGRSLGTKRVSSVQLVERFLAPATSRRT